MPYAVVIGIGRTPPVALHMKPPLQPPATTPELLIACAAAVLVLDIVPMRLVFPELSQITG
jgi:hypothetical protein